MQFMLSGTGSQQLSIYPGTSLGIHPQRFKSQLRAIPFSLVSPLDSFSFLIICIQYLHVILLLFKQVLLLLSKEAADAFCYRRLGITTLKEVFQCQPFLFCLQTYSHGRVGS